MELTTKIYIGRSLEDKTRFIDAVDWCCDNLGSYGDTWKIDWANSSIYLSEKNAILFYLKWG